MFSVSSSHLALRFYKNQGWTEELVSACLVQGRLRKFEDMIDSHDMSYWIGEVGTVFDVDLLYSKCSEIRHYDGKVLEGEDAKNYIKSMNW